MVEVGLLENDNAEETCRNKGKAEEYNATNRKEVSQATPSMAVFKWYQPHQRVQCFKDFLRSKDLSEITMKSIEECTHLRIKIERR